MRAAMLSVLGVLFGTAFAAPAQAQYGGDYYGERILRCESNDGRSQFCPADTRGGVRLARQVSDTPCVEGRSWGVRGDGIWVSHGCRGDFVLGYGGPHGGGWGGGGGEVVRCESRDGRWMHCDANTRGGVRLLRQLSSSRCIEGQTWGYDRRGVWVAGGCRADFRIRGGGWGGRDEAVQRVRCESGDGRSRFCQANTRGGVRLVRQLSRSPCVEGRSWGVQRGGIWVDHGCRGEFEVGYRRGYGWGPRDDDHGPPVWSMEESQ
ncbi:MAG TPA: DUF3011 domain-containing protein [Lysobacter sp.]|nr:DUF3011 domain-containing protein [Lysobacter sp.]